MNINMSGFHSFSFSGGLLNGTPGLKSTQQRMQRQEERDRQVAFFENQKENLKNVTCGSVEEIARKLELFHSYEDQIKAAKAAYNNEQMWHMMDESREIGEKIAEAVEKSEPKTAEERKEELVEEITGAESGGLMEELDEMMEEALRLQEELRTEEVRETVETGMPEEVAMTDREQTAEGDSRQVTEPDAKGAVQEELQQEAAAESTAESVQKYADYIMEEEAYMTPQELLRSGMPYYRPVDIKA